jgi:hypothetical protein
MTHNHKLRCEAHARALMSSYESSPYQGFYKSADSMFKYMDNADSANDAIDFAVTLGDEASEFLKLWSSRQFDTIETKWPKFYPRT